MLLPQLRHPLLQKSSQSIAAWNLNILVNKALHKPVIPFSRAAMGKVSSREATDITIKKRGYMIQLMEDGNQLVSKCPVEKPGDHEVDYVEDFPPLMGDFGHCAAQSGATSPHRLDDAPFRKSQRVNLGKEPVQRAAAGGVHTNEEARWIYMGKRLMSCRYIGYEAFELCCQIEGCHADYLQRQKTCLCLLFLLLMAEQATHRSTAGLCRMFLGELDLHTVMT